MEINKYDFEYKIEIHDPSIIFFHSYYGFDTLNNIKEKVDKIKEKGIIIEDLTQSLFSNITHIGADYYIGSFRKWFGIPDGGFAINVKDYFKYKPTTINHEFVKLRLRALSLKNCYINQNKGNVLDFLKLYTISENILDKDKNIYAISNQSKHILEKIDIEYIAIKRIKNFSYLLEEIKYIDIVKPIFKSIREYEVPLYFPIYINIHRDNLREYLANNKVYAPIIWPIPEFVIPYIDNVTYKIYNNILAIPCDHRYDICDMKRIIELLKKCNLSN